MVFDLDFSSFQFVDEKRYPPVKIKGAIKKADITNQRMFVILTSLNIMQVL